MNDADALRFHFTPDAFTTLAIRLRGSMSKIGPDFTRIRREPLPTDFRASTIFRLRPVLAIAAGTMMLPRSKLIDSHESPLCNSSRRTPPKAISAKIRHEIRISRVQQPRHFRWRVNLNLALLDLVGSERIGRGFLVRSQPSLRLGEIEQDNQQPATVVFRHEADAFRVEVLPQIFRLNAGQWTLESLRRNHRATRECR